MSGWKKCIWLIVWCGVALVLRLGVMWAESDQLVQDRDLYLGIAQELRAGNGYATPGSVPPRATAFRPPLYPVLLAITGPNPRWIGTLHLLLSAGMVTAVGLAAYRLSGGHRLWCLAPGIVAVDPLLLLYSRQPMTETLCACLSAVLIWRVACREQSGFTGKAACGEGILWGLCLLARPTYGAAMGIWLLWDVIRGSPVVHPEGTEAQSASREKRWNSIRHLVLVLAITLLTLSPWAIRNWQVFGRPIVTTTHGGYTLWLANNPDYYQLVVEGGEPVWDGSQLSRWQAANDRLLDEQGIHGEVARDQAYSKRAIRFIQQNPGRFVRACVLRARRFWGITPSQAEGDGQNLPIVWGVGCFYLLLWGGGIAGGIRLIGARIPVNTGVMVTLSLLLGFFLVHLVYWTDVRMRAPIMPAVAVFTAVIWGVTSRNRTPDT